MRFDRSSMSHVFSVLMLVSLLSVAASAKSGKEEAALPAPSQADSMGPMAPPGITLDNFGVVDGRIYRGEQPAPEDYTRLKSFGVSTIIDLREDAKSFAKESAEAAGLKYINIPMDDGDKPYDNQVADFLKAVTDESNGKVYVHCAGGRHRTGATIAAYRMAVNGWDADVAYKEMKAYDFYTRWGHGGYKTYVFDYYERMQKDPSSVPMAHVAPIAPEIADAMIDLK